MIDSESGMVCLSCQKYGNKTEGPGGGQFAVGCKSYKLDSIVKHERSKGHEKSLLIEKAQSQESSDSSAMKIIHTLNKDIYQKLEKMFLNVFYIVTNNRPMTDYVWMCELDEKKGITLGKTYRNATAATCFLEAMAAVEYKKVAKDVQGARFISVIGDGSTDTSIKEQDLWYVRFCDHYTMETRVYLLGVATVEKANAENILTGLKSVVQTNLKIAWNDFSAKLIAIGCDGASVMVGARAGVVARVREEQKCVLTVHCMAHRIELAMKDSFKSVKLADKAITVLLMGLYYFYRNSPLNRSMLVRSWKAHKTGSESLLVPSRVGGTRWVGHLVRALTNLTGSYRYVVAHLQQVIIYFLYYYCFIYFTFMLTVVS